MDKVALAYFSSINPLAKRISEDCMKIEVECESEWDNWEWQRREQIIDDFLIHSLVKNRYKEEDVTNCDCVESFPKLCLPSGEKIVVDFDNDCWTWQDEHSGPFSWKTKSQQDLSIKDLESTELTKSKTAINSTRPRQNGGSKVREGPSKIAVSRRIWDSPFHVGERKGDSGYPSSQDSIQSSIDDVHQVLDVDQGTEVATKPAILHISQKPQHDSKPVKSPLKSPIVSHLTLSPGFKKREDETGVNLLVDNKRDSVGQDNAAFDSVMEGEDSQGIVCSGGNNQDVIRLGEGEWSSFLGESSTDTLDDDLMTSPSRRPLLNTAGSPCSVDTDGASNPAVKHSQSETNDDDDNLVKSGFDFLDNW